jgi:hypothetical protein
MRKEEIQSRIESLIDDASLDVSSRKVTKLTNLASELMDDVDITLDEIVEDFQKVAGDDLEDWSEFIQEVSNFVFETIEEELGDEEPEQED